MRLAELAVLMLFSAQAMVYGWDHPCWHENCDKLHVPDDLQILPLDFRRDASYLTIDLLWCRSELSVGTVTTGRELEYILPITLTEVPL